MSRNVKENKKRFSLDENVQFIWGSVGQIRKAKQTQKENIWRMMGGGVGQRVEKI